MDVEILRLGFGSFSGAVSLTLCLLILLFGNGRRFVVL